MSETAKYDEAQEVLNEYLREVVKAPLIGSFGEWLKTKKKPTPAWDRWEVFWSEANPDGQTSAELFNDAMLAGVFTMGIDIVLAELSTWSSSSSVVAMMQLLRRTKTEVENE